MAKVVGEDCTYRLIIRPKALFTAKIRGPDNDSDPHACVTRDLQALDFRVHGYNRIIAQIGTLIHM